MNTGNRFLAAIIIVLFGGLMSPAFAQGRQVIKGFNHIPKEALVNYRGPMDPQRRMNLAISMPGRNQAERDQLLSGLYDPKSPQYRHFLSAQEYAKRFGASLSDYNVVADFFRSKGFKVTASQGHLLLDINGTVKMVEDVFHVTLNIYYHPTEKRDFFTADHDPSVDLGIPLAGIIGLDNFTRPCPAWGCDGPHRRAINQSLEVR